MPDAPHLDRPFSLPFADWCHQSQGGTAADPLVLDAVVVGSGYGGSVAALRLAELGHRVVLLERGSEFLPGDFANDIGQLPKYLRATGVNGVMGSPTGLFDVRLGQGLASLVANGLGGGSLINAGVMMRPDADVFAQDEWPAEFRHGLDDQAASASCVLGMEAAFQKAAQMLGGEVFRDVGHAPGEFSELPKALALLHMGEVLRCDRKLRAADQRDGARPGGDDGVRASQRRPTLDFTAKPATVTIDLEKCTRCGDCFSGCNVPGAKRTLQTSYLARARAAGAEVVTRATVYRVAPALDGAWDLYVLPTEALHYARKLADSAALHGTRLRAKLLVIAAGTFGSTELLLRSQHLEGDRAFPLSPALGTRLSGNGDSLTALADLPEHVNGVGYGASAPSTRGANAQSTSTANARSVPGSQLSPPAAPKTVGPTITTLLDLRGHPQLTQRVVIEDGATPGALARVYQEILASAWTLRHLGERSRAPIASGRAGQHNDPLAAASALAQHTQMLLTMGHDGSAGRVVWLPEMDGAVPYWVDPQKCETHARQQELFDAAQRGTGGVHLHTPLWRALSPPLSALFADPNPQATALTVHPLGGCPMHERFEHGVVNHRGQVWKSEHVVWPNLFVLDGACVPTSLGCNPLWTITALAERAMAWLAAEPQYPLTAPSTSAAASASAAAASTAPAMPTAQPSVQPPLPERTPLPLARAANPNFDFSVSERLELKALSLRGALRRSMGDGRSDIEVKVETDLFLRMRAADWTRLWDEDAEHRLVDVSGRLRLVAPTAANAGTKRLEYRVTSGSVSLFAHRKPLPVLGTLWRGLHVLNVVATWLLLHARRDTSGLDLRSIALNAALWVRLAWQLAEVRHVRYDLRLELCRDSGAKDPPKQLQLHATKEVRYAATWREIAVHRWRRFRQRHWPWDAPGRQHVGELRSPLIAQLMQPEIRLFDTRSWAACLPAALATRLPPWLIGCTAGEYAMDPQEVLQRAPARLHSGGDSTAAALALAAYPALLLRYLATTRLAEARLPRYSGDPVLDDASPHDLGLRLAPNAPHSEWLQPEAVTLSVPRGESSSDDGEEDSRDVALRLWRYRQVDRLTRQARAALIEPGDWCELPVRRAKVVVLLHAFDMSGYAYTFKETEQNFAEYLYAQGWEVWVADLRMSPRTRSAREPCTVDQLGFHDAPGIVNHVIAILDKESGDPLEPDAAPLQIYAFGQCMGAAAALIGLLGGRLSYPSREAGPAYAATTGERPLMPKLAGLVTSQTHPFMVGARDAQAKLWMAALLRDLAGRSLVPLGLRGEVNSVAEAWVDRLFAVAPVPRGEHCPGEGEAARHDDDDCATCRRIRFLLGPMFSHAKLNVETHRALPRLFGSGSVRLFAQGSKFIEYERLCSEDGINAYVTDEAIGRYLALPIRFMHGELNGLFDAESATRSAKHHRRIHTRWAERWGLPGTGASLRPLRPGLLPQEASERLACDVIPGYGHLDVLIGRDAATRADVDAGAGTYERLAALLNGAWSEPQAMPRPQKTSAPGPTTVRFPKAGPFIGPVVDGPNGREIGVSFILDDAAPYDLPDWTCGAGALVGQGGSAGKRRFQPFAIETNHLAVPARDGLRSSSRCGAGSNGSVALRVAHTRFLLPSDPADAPRQIECVSYTRPRGAVAEPSAEELRNAIDLARANVALQRLLCDRPFPPSVADSRRRPQSPRLRQARIPSNVLVDAEPGAAIQLALSCCRYSGLPTDRERGEESLWRLLRRSRKFEARPDLLFLLGDQIYADRTAGLVDPESPVERYLLRHQKAFMSRPLRALLARVPTLCLADDHEFIDAYPLGRPLFRPRANGLPYAGVREAIARRVATEAVHAYQMMAAPATLRTEGWCTARRGGVRIFVFDTRLKRQKTGSGACTILTAPARQAFRDWLRTASGGSDLCCVVSASVVLPGLVPGADPANASPADSMQASQSERRMLLRQLVQRVPGRFVLISGDYHVSAFGEVRLDDRRVGAFVLAPPLYAPLSYANSSPSDVWLNERVELCGVGTLSVRAEPPSRGSGFGMLRCQRAGQGWELGFTTQSCDFDDTGEWRARNWPAMLLGVSERTDRRPVPS